MNTETNDRGNRKERTGVVVSDCQDKTIVVEISRRTSHELYKKVIQKNKKYYAHDANNEAKVGDVVVISETRPLSKMKRWRLINIVRQAVVD